MRVPLYIFALFGTASGAQIPLADVETTENGRFILRVPSDPMMTYRLWRSADLENSGEVVAVVPGDGNQLSLRDPAPMTSKGFYRIDATPIWWPVDTDADGIPDPFELLDFGAKNPLNAGVEIPEGDGATAIPDRETFDRMARGFPVAGAPGALQVKFLITDIDTESPKLHFLDTNEHDGHFRFARDVLDYRSDIASFNSALRTFNSQTYWTNSNRKNIAGSILAHDAVINPDGTPGVYVVEFWPSDPVADEFVTLAYNMVSRAMPFVDTRILYHPAGETQKALVRAGGETLSDAGVAIIDSATLFGDIEFTALNSGTGIGRLRLIGPGETATARDIAIFRTIPNELGRTGGIITDAPQNPLSHINIRARQDDVPNSFVRGAASREDIVALLGTTVRYEVTPNGFTLTPATDEEAADFLEALRPTESQSPTRDLTVREVAALDDLRHSDADAYGSKAANVAELGIILPSGIAPEGFAVPFAFYDEFLRHNRLDSLIPQILAEPDFASDADYRERRLDDIRKAITRGTTPPEILEAIGTLQTSFPENTPIRCRSSANIEDLEGFNGAGLFGSFTHNPDEGHLIKSIKQVWASTWTERAFAERDFSRIPHLEASMGVLCHPAYKDEQANGVAVTRNLFNPDPFWVGYYINAQVGESLVTNPDPDALPEEFLISQIGQRNPFTGEYPFEIQYARFSNLVEEGETVLSREQAIELSDQLEIIQNRFRVIYDPTRENPEFAMEVEFKITSDGSLAIKQARPYVD